MNNIPKCNYAQQKKFKWFQSEILTDSNLTTSQKEILVFLQLIQIGGIVPLCSLISRWSQKPNSSKVIPPSQLKVHLRFLEKGGYIKRLKEYKKYTAIEVLYNNHSDKKITYVDATIPKDITLSMSDIYNFCVRQTLETKERSWQSYMSVKIGQSRNTFAKYTKRLQIHGYLDRSSVKFKDYRINRYSINKNYLLLFKRKATVYKAQTQKDDFCAHVFLINIKNKTLKSYQKDFSEKERFSWNLPGYKKGLAEKFSRMKDPEIRFMRKYVRSILEKRGVLPRVYNFDSLFDKLLFDRLPKNEKILFENVFHFCSYLAGMMTNLVNGSKKKDFVNVNIPKLAAPFMPLLKKTCLQHTAPPLRWDDQY
jgi:hypothetical protein